MGMVVRIVKQTSTRAIVRATRYAGLRGLAAIVVLLLLTACASNAPTKQDSKKTVKKSCFALQQEKTTSADKSTNPNDPNFKANANNECLPKGVIEISENFEVAPQIREEFREANMLLKKEEYPEAIRLLKGVIGKTGKFSAPYINLGIAFARTGELEKAEENLKKALELSTNHPVANNELGLVYRQTGRYQEARDLYESLLAVYPDFLPARKNLGVLCDIYIQDLECAMTQYQEYLKGVPDDEKVTIWVADVKSRM
jgi:Flp pilus assembly protein TadD